MTGQDRLKTLVAEAKRGLWQRELDALYDMSAGLTAAESARLRGSTPDGIQNVRTRAYRVLGARNGAHAVAIAVKAGLI